MKIRRYRQTDQPPRLVTPIGDIQSGTLTTTNRFVVTASDIGAVLHDLGRHSPGHREIRNHASNHGVRRQHTSVPDLGAAQHTDLRSQPAVRSDAYWRGDDALVLDRD